MWSVRYCLTNLLSGLICIYLTFVFAIPWWIVVFIHISCQIIGIPDSHTLTWQVKGNDTLRENCHRTCHKVIHFGGPSWVQPCRAAKVNMLHTFYCLLTVTKWNLLSNTFDSCRSAMLQNVLKHAVNKLRNNICKLLLSLCFKEIVFVNANWWWE